MTDTILLPKKRFVFIGAGSLGRILIERLLAFGIPTTSVTVCDIEQERGAQIEAKYHVLITTLDDQYPGATSSYMILQAAADT